MPRLSVITRAISVLGASVLTAVLLAQWYYGPEDTDKSVLVKWGSPPAMNALWFDYAAEYDAIFLAPGAWERRSTPALN